MVLISPILQNSLNNNSQNASLNSFDRHEKFYEDLAKKPHKIKPNEPKAKLIKQGPVEGMFSAVKDTAKDGANFFKAAKTGKMNDNSLGRINDLGMKIGGLLIAIFLASKSKTKTAAIMEFIGGGSFFASMALWPKIFINLPSKLIHGVDPGQRYISAQGDKKDFYLDNQFLVWDATDIKDEKEQRRHQKTALQNRTLWMATAGFATPLMTSLFCNFISPKVENGVIEHGIKTAEKNLAGEKTIFQKVSSKTKEVCSKVKGFFITPSPAKNKAHNEDLIENLFNSYKDKELDKKFFEELADYMSLNDMSKEFANIDDTGAIKTFSEKNLADVLEQYCKQNTPVNKNSLKEALKGMGIKKLQGLKILSDKEIDDLIASLGDNLSLENVEEKLKEINIPSSEIKSRLNNIKLDYTPFFENIRTYNKETVTPFRDNVKTFIKNINPIVGAGSESAYTRTYSDTLNNLIKNPAFGENGKTLKKNLLERDKYLGNEVSLKDKIKNRVFSLFKKQEKSSVKSSVKDNAYEATSLRKFFEGVVKDVEFGSEEYKGLISDLSKPMERMPDRELIDKISNENTIRNLRPDSAYSELDKVFFGKEYYSSIQKNIHNFIINQKTDKEAIVSRPIICANFEARLKEGLIEVNGKDIRQIPGALNCALKMIYKGNRNVLENFTGSPDKTLFRDLCDAIFDENAFKNEPEIVQNNVGKIREYLKLLTESTTDGNKQNMLNWMSSEHKQFTCCHISELVRKFAIKMSNDRAWLKIFGSMSIALVAVTLLVQPFFGNIKNEYPDDNAKGGKK